MTNEERFKRLLASKLEKIKTSEADDAMWQAISVGITPKIRAKYWPEVSIAASIILVAMLFFSISMPFENTSVSAKLSAELYLMDIELQRAVLNEAQSDEVSKFMAQRTAIALQQSERYEL